MLSYILDLFSQNLLTHPNNGSTINHHGDTHSVSDARMTKHVQRRALQVISGNIPSHCSLSFLPRGKKERLQWEGMLPKMT